MAVLYVSPSWFYWVSIIFEIIFALVTGAVAFYSFKVYNLTKQRDSKLFGFGFLFISLSYIVWLLINLFLLNKIDNGMHVLDLNKIAFLGILGVYSHIIFFTIGLLTLIYLTLKVENIQIYFMLVILTFLCLILSFNKALAFYLLSSVFLLYIVYHYIVQYVKKRKTKSLLVLNAFILLAISFIQFIFASQNYLYYVFGHFLELIAYVILLFQLIIIKKR